MQMQIQERRIHARRFIDVEVRIYHSKFGILEGRIRDISDGGCGIMLDDIAERIEYDGDIDEEFITLKPINMDVVFRMAFIRQHEDGMVLRFEDCVDGEIKIDAL